MIFQPLNLLILLVAAHAVCDYPLQGEFLAKSKNRFTRPHVFGVPWWQALAAHALIHAGAVVLITQIWWLGVAEFVIHFITDDRKCAGKLTYNQDQAIHIACKIAWWLIALYIYRTSL